MVSLRAERRNLQLNLDIPAEIMEVLDELRRAGGEVLLVGGVVRDALLGHRSRDYDVATSLRPDAIELVLPEVRAEFGAARATIATAGGVSMQVSLAIPY